MDIAKHLTIRKAEKTDMKYVFEMIKELAVFENMADQVKVTAKTLETDGFSENPVFTCYVAEVNNKIIGYTLYYICYSTWIGKSIFLEDLYVKDKYRKQGIGKKLILTIAKLAYETSSRLDFHVLSWNPAIEFYKSLGAVNLSDTENWQLFRLNKDSLCKLFN
ncbi:PREDICTED: diamine acetyltransferase 2 [Nicrophorus vespilloides]|uniref:Diamine acetyltransferase 2 n=1 Tax=Nicrophorus vespilloides TaxID=110193 RepID=A0ABM1NGC2_NICVS|nr:PREDICTED: diamine acetyltransferase 2 [Nicrophorus vespilloides]